MLPDSPSWNQWVLCLYSLDLFCILLVLILFHSVSYYSQSCSKKVQDKSPKSTFTINFQHRKRKRTRKILVACKFSVFLEEQRLRPHSTSLGSSKSPDLWEVRSWDEPTWSLWRYSDLVLGHLQTCPSYRTWGISSKQYQLPLQLSSEVSGEQFLEIKPIKGILSLGLGHCKRNPLGARKELFHWRKEGYFLPQLTIRVLGKRKYYRAWDYMHIIKGKLTNPKSWFSQPIGTRWEAQQQSVGSVCAQTQEMGSTGQPCELWAAAATDELQN